MKGKKGRDRRNKAIAIIALILFISLIFYVRASYTGMAAKDYKADVFMGKDVSVARSENYEATVVISTGPSVGNLDISKKAENEGGNTES